MTDPRPIGGTHARTQCNSCGGAWQTSRDCLVQVRFGDTHPLVLEEWHRPYELICDSCIELVWGVGIGE